MEKYNIEELLNEIDFTKNKYVKINDKLMLTNYQISVLERFNINIKNAPSLSYIIFEAENNTSRLNIMPHLLVEVSYP